MCGRCTGSLRLIRAPGSAAKFAGPPPFWRKAGSTIASVGSCSTASQASLSDRYLPRSSRTGGPPAMKRSSKAVRFHIACSSIPFTRKSPEVRASGATCVTPSSETSWFAVTGFDGLDERMTLYPPWTCLGRRLDLAVDHVCERRDEGEDEDDERVHGDRQPGARPTRKRIGEAESQRERAASSHETESSAQTLLLE